MGMQLALRNPIRVKGKEVSELALRDVTGQDALEIGLPYALISLSDNEFSGLEFRTSVLVKYISRLAGIPVEAVKGMSPGDLGRCQAFIFGFFDVKVAGHG